MFIWREAKLKNLMKSKIKKKILHSVQFHYFIIIITVIVIIILINLDTKDNDDYLVVYFTVIKNKLIILYNRYITASFTRRIELT